MQVVFLSKHWQQFREIRQGLLHVPKLKLLDSLQLPDYQLQALEAGSLETALNKQALHAALAFGQTILVETSFLQIPSLGKRPFVASTSKELEDRDGYQLIALTTLLHLLKDKEAYERECHYISRLTLAEPDGTLKNFEAGIEGNLLLDETQSGGLDFDSIFTKHSYNKTLAELSEEVKGRVSHRGKALEKLAIKLELLQHTS